MSLNQKIKHDFFANKHQWCIRQMELSDVSYFIDYWFDPDQRQDHITGGIDFSKLGTAEEMRIAYETGLKRQDTATKRNAMNLVIDCDGEPIGNVVIVDLDSSEEQHMHAHIWHPKNRRQGIGSAVFFKIFEVIFANFNIVKIVIQPSSQNHAINALIQKFGIKPVKTFVTQPSQLTRTMEVNRYEIDHVVLSQLLPANR